MWGWTGGTVLWECRGCGILDRYGLLGTTARAGCLVVYAVRRWPCDLCDSVNMVLVRSWARRTSRVALGPLGAVMCRLGSGLRGMSVASFTREFV